jgi:putative DNA primase/helicase
MVQGCQKYLAEGLPATGDISTATAAYREEMDVLGNFLDERCIISPSLSASVRDLYRAFVSRAEQAGEYPIHRGSLGLGWLNVASGKSTRGGLVWVGIGIKNDIPDIEDN